MCDYQGYEFGAGAYPDSVCIDGTLHDADRCDDNGNIYLNSEDIPCPICRRDAAIEWHFERWSYSCEGGDERDWDTINEEHLSRAIHLVDDIRKNRGLGPT